MSKPNRATVPELASGSRNEPARVSPSQLSSLGAVLLGLLTGCGAGVAPHAPSDLRPLAGGFYSVRPPAEEQGPLDAAGAAALPKVVTGFDQPPQTNDWWSSLIWSYRAGKEKNPYSEPMFPHPLTMQAEARGLWLGYSTEPTVDERGYFFPHRPELLVGVAGLAATETRVVRYGDWTVTARWRDSGRPLRGLDRDRTLA